MPFVQNENSTVHIESMAFVDIGYGSIDRRTSHAVTVQKPSQLYSLPPCQLGICNAKLYNNAA
jgi:hypothetical protein